MLQGGDDPKFILRRLTRMAMEDIGLADPNALLLANAARQAFEFMGIPEGLIGLDEVVVYLSLAPKSNAVEIAGMTADAIIKRTGTLPVPRAFRNSVTKVGEALGYGDGYRYDHDSPGAYSAQEHLPKQLEGTEIYKPTEYGKEKQLAERLRSLKEIKRNAQGNTGK